MFRRCSHIVIVAAVILCMGCKKEKPLGFSFEESARIIERIRTDRRLTDKDYKAMLSQLDGMLEFACVKAENTIDSGYRLEDVRGRLEMDSVFCKTVELGVILDSALVEYLHSPYSNPKLKKEYRDILSRYTRRATKSGLFVL